MPVETRRAPLTERQVEQMLTVFIRKKQAMETARRQLGATDFAGHHRNLAVMWSVVCDHVDEFQAMPSETHVMGEIERRLAEDPEALSEEEEENLDAFLARAYVADIAKFTKHVVRVAFKYLRVYLEDRIADRIRADLTNSTYTPGDLCALLSDYQADVSKVQSIEPTGLPRPFPEGWDQTQSAVVKSTTSLEFWDDMLNGGQAEKEVYGILGPFGSCKTTIAIQYGTSQASLLRKKWTSNNKQGKLKTVYMFIYESDVAEMRLRALSSLGMIDRNVLEAGVWEDMSQAGSLKSYERSMFRSALQQNQYVPSERERYRIVQRALNINWRIVDMTGNDPANPGRGWGLVDEIASIIQMDQDYQESQGITPGVGPIIIDYAGAAVKRYLVHHGKDFSTEMRHLLNNLPMQCKNKLAISFRTQILVLHQLTGAANAMSAGVLPGSTDAAETKSWGENLDFSFVVGNPDVNNRVVFGCDKHRRAPGTSEVVIKIGGKYCRVDYDPDYTVDHVQRKIVPTSDLQSIDEAEGPAPPAHHDDDDTPVDDVTTQTNQVRRTARMGGRRAEGR